ncbi:MAG: PDZ domain-containing protein [Acidobacteriota bacterium]|nr:PDZ domain-containing protein [Acidobacteriota bacterium]
MRYLNVCTALFATLIPGFAAKERPLLLQQPTLSQTHIVFSYAGDLWSVARAGGNATRLTTGLGAESNPLFSPDGRQIAFRGEYEGNSDVYVIPAQGGQPKRLTFHPADDTPVAWTPDGDSILFRTTRDSYSRFSRLYTVPARGGFETPVDLPMAYAGSYSPDSRSLAYMPLSPAFAMWKNYRGGETTKIWLARLSDAHVEEIPRNNSNDFNPMWTGSSVYFLSDRGGPVSLWCFDTGSKKLTEAVRNTGLDLKSASAGPGAIVYEQFGTIFLYDLNSKKSNRVDVSVLGDLPSLRPRFENVSLVIRQASLSPTGARALFEARGDIFTVPVEKGDVRDITNTPGVFERFPSWSPDGKQIAYFSDASGEYQLHLRAQNGQGEVRVINPGKPAFYYDPVWAPDSKKIVYRDSMLQLWVLDLAKPVPMLIDHDTYDVPARNLNPHWSPDSKWIAYTKLMKNHLRTVFLYSLATGKTAQVSDGMSDAEDAQFDPNGKYLYFTASTDTALTTAWLDMSSDGHAVTRSVYVTVLNKNDPSPLAPESDEEKTAEEVKEIAADKKPTEKPAKSPVVQVQIDLENIGQRILALPVPARDYSNMTVGKTGVLFVSELLRAVSDAPRTGPPAITVQKFDLKTRKTDKLLDSVTSFDVSANGEKMLYKQGLNWIIASTSVPLKPGEGILKLENMQARVDPMAEYRQMYQEAWRVERDFFYDPNLHGVSFDTTRKQFEPYLEGVGSRADLTYLFQEMLGGMSVGHLRTGGGALPVLPSARTGLLGADYRVDNGRYRIERVFGGENWNPGLKAPLTQPGVNVKAGEYVLAVNDRELRAPDNIYSYFEQTVGRPVALKVGPTADGKGSREVTVIPVESELGLRNLAWIEENRRKVDQLSGGKLAYIYMPNTGEGGFTSFNRYYFAQLGKEGAVIDERFNGGGQIADYVIDELKRKQTNFFMTRAGEPFTTPQNAIFGPKAMIINEYAGSGGDAMPWLFRDQKIGPLIGKRTWGGLVGIFGAPPLMDGGMLTAPNLAFYNLKGEWDVENHGVAPDYDVEFDPAAVRKGHDPQLEKAVALVMEDLAKHPQPKYKVPAFPNYHKNGAAPVATDGQ